MGLSRWRDGRVIVYDYSVEDVLQPIEVAVAIVKVAKGGYISVGLWVVGGRSHR